MGAVPEVLPKHLFEPNNILSIGPSHFDGLDAKLADAAGMLLPAFLCARVQAKIGRHLVEEQWAARQRPDVALDLPIWHNPQTRLLKQVSQFMADDMKRRYGLPADVQADAKIFTCGVTLEPPVLCYTHQNSPTSKLGELEVRSLDSAQQLWRHSILHGSSEC
jgi:hypothetical protein